MTAVSRKGDSRVAKPRQPCHPNFLITDDRTSATTADTEPGGPRRALKALGPLGELEADLRQRLGEDFRRLAGVKLTDRTDTMVTLSVLTAAKRDEIIKHCKAAILAAAGVSELNFEFAMKVEPPLLRRMPS